MVFTKVGINLTKLQNVTPPNMTSFNISTDPLNIINQIPAKANEVTHNYFGLGIMLSLFIYLVWKLGDRLEFEGEQFSTLRTVGISAGIVSLIGFQMMVIGYFTEFSHLVIFLGIFLTAFVWLIIEDKRSV